MFEIELPSAGVVSIRGRLDAAQADKAQTFLDEVDGTFVVDFSDLEYISSAGLGVLLKTHKRLVAAGDALKIVKANSHITNIFKYSGFDKLFNIETD